MNVKIAPSLLSADFAALGDAARACQDAGAEYLHFDVMDAHFVPNLTFGAGVVHALRPYSDAFFDVHLMVDGPELLVSEVAKAGADGITVHPEASVHLQRTLRQIRELGKRAGIALNPATPLDVLEYVLDDIDLLLVMSVNPGFGGQSFIPGMMRKVADARKLIANAGHPIELQVDGGVGPRNIAKIVRAGCTVVVAGSSVFGHAGGVAGGVRALREACAGG